MKHLGHVLGVLYARGEDQHRLAVFRVLGDFIAGRLDQVLSLHYESGLTQDEVAEVLGIPAGTVRQRVSRGLGRLRETLGRMGISAAAAVLIGGLGQAAPEVPATLSAALGELVAGQLAVKGTGVTASTTLKGGLIVKIGLGIAAAGLVAGGALWAGVGSAESRGPKAESPPVTTAWPAPLELVQILS